MDMVAKKVVHDYKANSGLYQRVVRSKLEAIKIRHQVDSFHLHLPFASLGLEQDVPILYVAPVALVTQGSPWVAVPPVLSRNGFHESFVRQVFNWFGSLQWFEGCSPGPVCGGPLTLVLCPRLGLMVVGCVLGMTRRPFVASRRYTLFCTSWDVDTWCASLGRFFGGQFGGFVCPFGGYSASWRSAGGSSGFSVAVCCDSVSSLVAFAPRIYGECFVGLMARNPASYVSSLTLVT